MPSITKSRNKKNRKANEIKTTGFGDERRTPRIRNKDLACDNGSPWWRCEESFKRFVKFSSEKSGTNHTNSNRNAEDDTDG